MDIIRVRFAESQSYDINIDSDVVRFMAITDRGTFWTDVPIEGPIGLRRDREKFKSIAVDYIRAGALPCQIELEAEEH